MDSMVGENLRHYLDLSDAVERLLIAGARDGDPVRGLTHGHYKYPARFSPVFARAAIEAFTRPGDLCIDPHVGGGTTLVEALAAGRDAIGVDVSSLAEFVSGVKTMVFTLRELKQLASWSNIVGRSINIHNSSRSIPDYSRLGYYKHLAHPSRWRLRKAIEQSLSTAVRLDSPRLEAFARCAILRTAQWALDGRRKLPGIEEFRLVLVDTAREMIEGATSLRTIVITNGCKRPTIKILHRSANGVENDNRVGTKVPKLILTSPPYPGIHVLYHRWQVDGRKEAPLPFMIANRLDGAGSSFYTMGDRKHPGLKTYFAGIVGTMSSVAAISNENTIFVQMIAFSEADWQLERYLEAMMQAGLQEIFLRSMKAEGDGRLWRQVPGRRWYSDQRDSTPGSMEVVLFHKLSAPQGHSVIRTRECSSREASPS
jgi:hypothetical protein